MAEKMKEYKIFRCPYCNCEYYDKTARKGKKVGDPMMECPECGKKSYRKTVLEPALIGGGRYFDIKFSSLYGNLRIGLILIYAVFLFVILTTKDFIMSLYFVGIALLLYVIYEAIRMKHKISYLKTQEYNDAVTASLVRLSDISYAKMVVKSQGAEKTSVYYYELHKNDSDEKGKGMKK